MTDIIDLLNTAQTAVVFDDSDIRVLTDISEAVEFAQGHVVFRENDIGDCVYLIESGAVDLYTVLHDNIEQTIITLRTGGFVGALAMIEDNDRGINCRAAVDTTAYRFDGEKIRSLISKEIGLGAKLLRVLNDILSKRLRIVMGSLQQNLKWTMEVSGLANLDLSQLIVEKVNVVIDLVNGKQLNGIIMKAEERSSGFELFLKTSDKDIHFIPYHAIVSASLPSDAVKANLSEFSNL